MELNHVLDLDMGSEGSSGIKTIRRPTSGTEANMEAKIDPICHDWTHTWSMDACNLPSEIISEAMFSARSEGTPRSVPSSYKHNDHVYVFFYCVSEVAVSNAQISHGTVHTALLSPSWVKAAGS